MYNLVLSEQYIIKTFKLLIRFWSKVDIKSNDECWLWTASRRRDGYGQFGINGRMVGAHIVAFMMTNGKLSNNSVVRHSCDIPTCCNPLHLLSGTAIDNINDKMSRNRWLGGAKVIQKSKFTRTGQNHHWSKLSIEDIIEIRKSNNSLNDLARKYNVTKGCIHNIIKRKTWKYYGI